MQLKDKKIWVTSDWHLGHKNVIKYANRPFKDITEMNNILRKNFNKVVESHDIVYILGDISFLNTVSTTEWIKSLNGFKFLIKGNHDPKTNTAYRKMGFSEVYDHPILLGNKYLLSHEPVEAYMPGLVNIYGHLHDKAVNDSPNRFCCCVEQTDYKPISLTDIEKHLTNQVPF